MMHDMSSRGPLRTGVVIIPAASLAGALPHEAWVDLVLGNVELIAIPLVLRAALLKLLVRGADVEHRFTSVESTPLALLHGLGHNGLMGRNLCALAEAEHPAASTRAATSLNVRQSRPGCVIVLDPVRGWTPEPTKQ